MGGPRRKLGRKSFLQNLAQCFARKRALSILNHAHGIWNMQNQFQFSNDTESRPIEITITAWVLSQVVSSCVLSQWLILLTEHCKTRTSLDYDRTPSYRNNVASPVNDSAIFARICHTKVQRQYDHNHDRNSLTFQAPPRVVINFLWRSQTFFWICNEEICNFQRPFFSYYANGLSVVRAPKRTEKKSRSPSGSLV